ncbi:MAG: gamma-glutamyl-gamma-aminobutyrate hydrolase family protein [Lachnospiraceae bacterium]|nr:gamma-glutamyl-gamma-aminobutyrate hydrolase family protein [Lachnospiraceae bacterium]
MKIGIVGRKKATHNYEIFLHTANIPYITSLSLGRLASCDALLFPGGGDISPALFGATNQGSRNIDIELDILQLRIFQEAFHQGLPMLGICKGMQLINVGLGGTILQDLPTAHHHTTEHTDLYHETVTAPDSYLFHLYGKHFLTNSRHHQAVEKLGSSLLPVQWCPIDHCVEALVHETLPIFGVQWHPERLDSNYTNINGLSLIKYFLSFV